MEKINIAFAFSSVEAVVCSGQATDLDKLGNKIGTVLLDTRRKNSTSASLVGCSKPFLFLSVKVAFCHRFLNGRNAYISSRFEWTLNKLDTLSWKLHNLLICDVP